MRKKINKIFSLILLGFLTLTCNSVSVKAYSTSNSLSDDETVMYWADKFPTLKKNIEDGILTGLAGTDSVYVKYTEDEDKNIKSKVYTENEYNLQNNNKILRSAIGGFIPDNGKNPYWLRLDLQVYETQDPEVLSATSYWEWKTKPIVRFTDIHGIYTSSSMIIGQANSLAAFGSQYITIDSHDNEWFTENPYKTSRYGNGIISGIKLRGNTELIQHDQHMGMLTTPVAFTSPSQKKGIINTSYMHKQFSFSFSDVSFDASGKPSFGGITPSYDEHGGSVSISR